MKRLTIIMVVLLGVTLVLGANIQSIRASESPAEFYANNTVTIVVPYGAGGGTDFVGRLVASFWPDVLKGTARVKNMPGGGNLVATNYVWKAKPDGLTLEVGVIGTTLATKALFKEPGMQFDITKFNYIGWFYDEPMALGISSKLPYKTAADLKKAKGLKLGTTSKVGGPAIGCALALELLGLEDGAVIAGYGSTAEVGLAVARGEVDGIVIAASSVNAEAKKGYLKPIVSVSNKRAAIFPNLPAISEAIDLSPDKLKLLKLHASAFGSARPLFGPPGMDQAKVEYLREAWMKLMGLKGLQRHAKTRAGAWEKPMSGAEVEKTIKEIMMTPQSDVDKLLSLLKKYVK